MAIGSYKQFCPVAMAAEILCTRWTVVLLRELVAGSTRFNELRRRVPRMSPALLSQRLKELEVAGIVTRKSSSERGVFEYRLTALHYVANRREYREFVGSEVGPLEPATEDGEEGKIKQCRLSATKPLSAHPRFRASGTCGVANSFPMNSCVFLFVGACMKLVRYERHYFVPPGARLNASNEAPRQSIGRRPTLQCKRYRRMFNIG